jgi:oligoribonuclease
MSDAKPSPAYFWFDLEFSDLNVESAHVLQVAALITDNQLTPLQPDDRGLNLTVALPSDAPLSDWVQENLADLIARCRTADAVPADQIEARLGPAATELRDRPVLAGNSVHMDWLLARRVYPSLLDRLHYRHLDVSSFKIEWLDRWRQEPFDKEDAALVARYLPFPLPQTEARPHDALYDIYASIAELQFYRQHLQLKTRD